MSAQLPACQLLERFYGQSANLWPVAPPADAWLRAHSTAMISGDVALREHWASGGKAAASPFDAPFIQPAGQVVLFWPKAHQLGIWWLTWLCHVLPENTPLDVVGEHQGGIKRVPKILSELGMRCDKLDNARRCSLFATRTVAMEQSDTEWQTFDALDLKLVSHPGVFGHGKVDEGTRLMLDSIEASLPKKPLSVLDMGCGDGIISAWLAARGHQVTAVDVSAFAVEACRRTLAANQLSGRVLESDVYSALGGEQFDLIVSNPPFHQEREITYGPSARLISEAPNHLSAKGQLVLVANAFLPYPDVLESTFGGFETLADNRRFKVYRAAK
ncbi:methyltransferase [Vreelandella venusta]|uniref:Methyltransferase n=1 Tax=Vreelandella venusta TaxID=44935 RepID=A0AAQ0CFH3_9GAMM|nr:methyltransferase [Halomonas venusta]QRL02003.1 methyltransferase [Halomonas venusta]WAM47351.1 methyltransferase [Halomonas venusta]WAM50848.1 methyltransferase [Halomonas venusta]GEK50692.1 ribosomal RNA small subunit methyltransferase C [Halomonas venusta]